jgi:hypothetical protein
VVLAAAGCGSSSTGTVSGKVYVNDVLVKGGTITFFGADNKGIPTKIGEDGSYTVENLAVGKAKICVDTSWLDPAKKKVYSYAPPPGKKDLPGPSTTSAGTFVAIPAKYADPQKTDLTLEVKGGRQSHDVRMKK